MVLLPTIAAAFNKMHLLFDIGGTHMRFATTNGKKLENIRILPTPKDYDSAIALFSKAAKNLDDGKITEIIGGVPRFTLGKLTYWYTNPTQKILQKITKTKVHLHNDAELSGLGEAVYGAGKKSDIIAYLTFSTGFGGSRIVHKKIDANYFGFEPRLQITQYDPKKKNSLFLDQYTSGRGILLRHKKQPERITDKKVWAEIENWMNVAALNASVFWSPEIVIIGGAVGTNKNISTIRMESFLKKGLHNMPNTPTVKKAELGQLSGLYGALAMTKQKRP
jgi:predicted NBD/HSP70 family sugar kinase